jgi:hypothetical protein
LPGSYEVLEIEVVLTESYIGQSSTDASGIGEAAGIICAGAAIIVCAEVDRLRELARSGLVRATLSAILQ